jgi:hypothetical protein
MQTSVGSSAAARLVGAIAALSLSAGSAWAGGGGQDAATLQTALDDACSALQMTSSCPQLPTLTQLVLEIAGLESAPLEVPRFENAIVPTVAVNAVNPPAGNALNPPAGSPFALSKVTPLAFISTSGSAAAVTQPGGPDANSFFYAATNGAPNLPPDSLNLVYDYPLLTNQNFAKGQFVADILVPLVVLNNNGTESEAPTTIQIRGTTGCGKVVPCVSATAVGNFGSGLKSVNASDLGLTVTLTFQQSPNSPPNSPHAIFAVQAKLIVTKSTDPAYFRTDPAYAQDPFATFLPPGFVNDELGFTPKFLGLPVGIAPYAAPKCTSVSCPPVPPPPPSSSTFPLCANIAADDGSERPAVAAFFSIGTVGTTYLSAPLVTPPQVTCPS